MTSNAPAVVLPFPGNEELAAEVAATLGTRRGTLALHRFPDEETGVRIADPVTGCDVVLVCTLDRPDSKLVALYLAALTARELGARRVFLVAPYLPYLRQDSRFHPGEGTSAVHVGHWLSGFLDGVVTAEPHLHRIQRLDQIFRVPARTVGAAGPIARWIRENVAKPVLVGSEGDRQAWIAGIAQALSCPHFMFNRLRHGDRDVELRLPTVAAQQERTPVLLDGIVSSGRTMIAAVELLRASGFSPPVCIAVHPLFSPEVCEQVLSVGAREVVTCNTVRHISNGIDLHRALALEARALLEQHPPAEAA
ncbi:MAG: ribose-phosphate diphosphokinase [Nevskia sp.]|nr:ribose-phosphate diphosphokinase [Nevskia sp.]